MYVGDVAVVDFGFKERSTYARLQLMQEERGNRLVRLSESGMYPVITLNVKKRSGANILDTADDIQAVLDEFPLPRGAQVLITGDQSEQVGQLVKDLENNIISGLIFVVLVLLFFLGVRTATLVGIAIPLSMFLSFLTLQILGQELNFVILFSLIIALGMLVDNAVVIVENIYRYKELGYSRFEAAKLGTAEVGSAVVASTATTVAVFIPMMFWPGITGEFMGYLPMTLIITLTCSLFVAIIINPVITGYFVRLDTDPKKRYAAVLRIGLFVFFAGIALIIGLTNWQTLAVLSLAIPVLMVLHRYCFNPIAKGFVASGMPKLISWYRKFLDAQLQRDYEVRSPAFARKRLWSAVALTYLAGLITAVASILMATPEGPSPLVRCCDFPWIGGCRAFHYRGLPHPQSLSAKFLLPCLFSIGLRPFSSGRTSRVIRQCCCRNCPSLSCGAVDGNGTRDGYPALLRDHLSGWNPKYQGRWFLCFAVFDYSGLDVTYSRGRIPDDPDPAQPPRNRHDYRGNGILLERENA